MTGRLRMSVFKGAGCAIVTPMYDDGRVNYANNLSYYGIKPYYRRITAASVDKNEFNG
jgi:hypothetical protein